jgi:hypothetical protein
MPRVVQLFTFTDDEYRAVVSFLEQLGGDRPEPASLRAFKVWVEKKLQHRYKAGYQAGYKSAIRGRQNKVETGEVDVG